MEKKKDLFPPVSDDIIKAIRESDAVAVTSHVNPDGDAVFSSLAMARNPLPWLGFSQHLVRMYVFSMMDHSSVRR